MTISSLSDTGVSPGRRFQPLILGLAVAIWALTHFTGYDSRDTSGLTLAYRLRIHPFQYHRWHGSSFRLSEQFLCTDQHASFMSVEGSGAGLVPGLDSFGFRHVLAA
jgi:hypothetical protein